MAFKRSAVRSRLSPPKKLRRVKQNLETTRFQGFCFCAPPLLPACHGAFYCIAIAEPQQTPPDHNGQAGFPLFSAASGVFPVRADMKTIHACGRISDRKRHSQPARTDHGYSAVRAVPVRRSWRGRYECAVRPRIAPAL